jgi:hypothetical protein
VQLPAALIRLTTEALASPLADPARLEQIAAICASNTLSTRDDAALG